MKNNSIINIDTTSYTNKDFRAIWSELLQLVNDLTDVWDPNNSNESDPGVALLKLKAFIADKLNYNIDKNTLENFPSSVTQRGNAQKLYDMLGYELRWYESAKTEVFFKFVNPSVDSAITKDTGIVTFTIPKFCQLKNSDGSIVYTTTEETTIDTGDNIQNEIGVPAIEGALETFLINGVDVITINNLDADYRLYFKESMVASNGIYINNVGVEELWEPTFNLESTQLGKKVYKFGVLPNTNTCYIEFPQDAAELFGQGINIKYVISSGANGNIKAKALQQFAQEYANAGTDDNGNTYSLNTYVKVTNPSGTNSGRDPESLESAYANFQKTINTFSTLITLEDYYNAIYNSGSVSNCVVTDRTTDFNFSYNVRSKNLMGDVEELFPLKDSKMNAFNIALYALDTHPMVFDKQSYDSTFLTGERVQRDGIASVEEYKSIPHDWVDLMSESSQVFSYLFKNLIEIKGQIITYEKKSAVEASAIIKNIKQKLYETYQSRNIKFGEDLSYDELIEVIISADSRIKNVILDDFEYDTKVLTPESKEYSLDLGSYEKQLADNIEGHIKNLKLEIVAKSILAGVTPLYLFDDTVKYSYLMGPVNAYTIEDTEDTEGQLKYDETTGNIIFNNVGSGGTGDLISAPYNNVSLITTQVDMNLGESEESAYEIKDHEQAYFYAPSYISTAQLSTYLYVCLHSPNSSFAHKVSLDGVSYSIAQVNSTTITITNLSNQQNKYSLTLNNKGTIGGKEYTVNKNGNNYTFTDSISGSSSTSTKETTAKSISKGMIYQLKEGEKLYVSETTLKGSGFDQKTGVINGINYSYDDITYLPTNETEISQIESNGKLFRVYGAGTLIKPSFDMKPELKGGIQEGVTTELKNYVNLESNKTIDIMEANISKINKKSSDDTSTKTVYCTWYVNDVSNRLFTDQDVNKAKSAVGDQVRIEHILQSNEMFIYTDATKSDLIILQSGTRVSIPYSNYKENVWKVAKPSMSDVNQYGTDALENFWVEIPRNLNYFEVEELQIHSLGSGVKVWSKNKELTLNNQPISLGADWDKIHWKTPDGEEYGLTGIELENSTQDPGWHAFSKLSVLSTPETPFELSSNQVIALFELDSTQEETKLTHLGTLGPGQSFVSDSILATDGGMLQNVQVFKEDETLGPISLTVFSQKQYDEDFWDVYGNYESDKNTTANLTLNESSEGVVETKISNPNYSAANTSKIITLETHLSDLFIPSFGINNGDIDPQGSVLPLILEVPQNVSVSFNHADVGGVIKIDTPIESFNNKYHNKLICLSLNPTNAGSSLRISLQGLEEGNTALIYLYPIKKYTNKNFQCIENLDLGMGAGGGRIVLLTNNKDAKDLSALNSISNIGNWEEGKKYPLYSIVQYNKKYYIAESEISEGNNTSSPNEASTYWKEQSVIPIYGTTEEIISGSGENASFNSNINLPQLISIGDPFKIIQDKVTKMSSDDNGVPLFDFSFNANEEQNAILNPLNPLSFYKSNHICNKMIISQIEKIDIKLARQSKQ